MLTQRIKASIARIEASLRVIESKAARPEPGSDKRRERELALSERARQLELGGRTQSATLNEQARALAASERSIELLQRRINDYESRIESHKQKEQDYRNRIARDVDLMKQTLDRHQFFRDRHDELMAQRNQTIATLRQDIRDRVAQRDNEIRDLRAQIENMELDDSDKRVESLHDEIRNLRRSNDILRSRTSEAIDNIDQIVETAREGSK